jgi:hypothetical protein
LSLEAAHGGVEQPEAKMGLAGMVPAEKDGGRDLGGCGALLSLTAFILGRIYKMVTVLVLLHSLSSLLIF